MRRNTGLSLFLLVFLVVIFALNFFGYRYGWYDMFSWYDIPMHILGGAWLGLSFTYILDGRVFIKGEDRKIISYLLFAAAVITVGIFWEIFEYSVDIYIFRKYTFLSVPSYVLRDSLFDLLNDTIGASAVFLLGWRAALKNTKSQSQTVTSGS